MPTSTKEHHKHAQQLKGTPQTERTRFGRPRTLQPMHPQVSAQTSTHKVNTTNKANYNCSKESSNIGARSHVLTRNTIFGRFPPLPAPLSTSVLGCSGILLENCSTEKTHSTTRSEEAPLRIRRARIRPSLRCFSGIGEPIQDELDAHDDPNHK